MKLLIYTRVSTQDQNVEQVTLDFLLWATGSLSDLITNFINK